MDLKVSIEGKHVLIVEDIVDTGLTLSCLIEKLKARNPASLKLASFYINHLRQNIPLILITLALRLIIYLLLVTDLIMQENIESYLLWGC